MKRPILALIVGLTFLIEGCYSSRVYNKRIIDPNSRIGYRFEGLDTNMDGRADLKKTYLICNGEEYLIIEEDRLERTIKVDSSYLRYSKKSLKRRGLTISPKMSYVYDEDCRL